MLRAPAAAAASQDDSEEKAIDKNDAAKAIIKLLPKGDTNYSVGVLSNGDLIISKVNGVTAATAAIENIRATIERTGLANGRRIYLAQSFNTSVGSNHAEMCIIAAAKEIGANLEIIYCTGPHCGFCSAMMDTTRVDKGNQAGNDHQMGWAHPLVPLSYGQQVNPDTESQLAELKKLPETPRKEEVKLGKWGFTNPRGKYKQWF